MRKCSWRKSWMRWDLTRWKPSLLSMIFNQNWNRCNSSNHHWNPRYNSPSQHWNSSKIENIMLNKCTRTLWEPRRRWMKWLTRQSNCDWRPLKWRESPRKRSFNSRRSGLDLSKSSLYFCSSSSNNNKRARNSNLLVKRMLWCRLIIGRATLICHG